MDAVPKHERVNRTVADTALKMPKKYLAYVGSLAYFAPNEIKSEEYYLVTEVAREADQYYFKLYRLDKPEKELVEIDVCCLDLNSNWIFV